MQCITGVSLRTGRPSRSTKEKQAINARVDVRRSAGVSGLAPPMSEITSPSAWLVDWENMLQPGGMQVDESSSHDFGFLDATSPNEGMNNHGTNAFVFEKTLGMNNSELFVVDAMDLAVENYGTSLPTDPEPVQNTKDGTSTSSLSQLPSTEPSRAVVHDEDENSEIYLEVMDLKEEVLRQLADLQSGLLADLNIMRSIRHTGGCSATSRVSLASSQRATDGKTENYNFPIGRMLERSEIFSSILHHFVPPTPPAQLESISNSTESEIYNEIQATTSVIDSGSNQASSSDDRSPSANSTNSSTGTLRCDVPITLSILTCYVYLTRIYRTIFNSIYNALLSAHNGEGELPPLFPGLNLAGFNLEPHLKLQVQILIEVSKSLLDKIDKSLGLPEGRGATAERGGILDQTGSFSLLERMMKDEAFEGMSGGSQGGRSLREIMRNIAHIC